MMDTFARRLAALEREVRRLARLSSGGGGGTVAAQRITEAPAALAQPRGQAFRPHLSARDVKVGASGLAVQEQGDGVRVEDVTTLIVPKGMLVNLGDGVVQLRYAARGSQQAEEADVALTLV